MTSLMEMITTLSNFSWKMEFMRVVNIDGTLHNPNGFTKNSYEPYLVFIAFFYTSSSTMKI
jgi:hypothetical protein